MFSSACALVHRHIDTCHLEQYLQANVAAFDLQILQMCHKVCQKAVCLCVCYGERVLIDSDYEFRGTDVQSVNDSLEKRKCATKEVLIYFNSKRQKT